jgi:hypothetical protein
MPDCNWIGSFQNAADSTGLGSDKVTVVDEPIDVSSDEPIYVSSDEDSLT